MRDGFPQVRPRFKMPLCCPVAAISSTYQVTNPSLYPQPFIPSFTLSKSNSCASHRFSLISSKTRSKEILRWGNVRTGQIPSPLQNRLFPLRQRKFPFLAVGQQDHFAAAAFCGDHHLF